jgi:hypothetical protein
MNVNLITPPPFIPQPASVKTNRQCLLFGTDPTDLGLTPLRQTPRNSGVLLTAYFENGPPVSVIWD